MELHLQAPMHLHDTHEEELLLNTRGGTGQLSEWGTNGSGLDFRQGQGTVFPHNYGTHPAFCSMGTGALSREVKRLELEDNHSPHEVSKLRKHCTTTPLYHLPSCCAA